MRNTDAPREGLIRRARRDEAGVSIVEVIVATMVFLVLSVAVAQATLVSIRLAGDQQHRVTALSLAASEIDRVRAVVDPFSVIDATTSETVDGTTYTITRDTSWVSGSGLDIPCGSGGTGNLQLKRVNVRVNWTGQMTPTTPVSSDTVLAPAGRINDPARGTVMIAVTRADGTGAAGVSVAVSPSSGGAAALDSQPDATNGEGCTYAMQVKPGTYAVSLSKSGYIDVDQNTSPSKEVTVTAGSTVNVSFGFDAASTFGLSFADGSGSNWFATNNETSLINTYGTYYVSGTPSSATFFPWSSGYTIIAGHYVAPDADGTGGCRAVDPSEWDAATVGTTALAAGELPAPVATTPGGTASTSVAMGIVRVNNLARNQYVTAVSVATATVAGQPTCEVGMTYRFGRESSSTSTSSRDLALPYGSWRLYYGGSSGSTSNSFSASNIDPRTNVVTSGMVSGNTVTLDPRGAP
ncbi:carboxypeptidase-like regulatory domain-containing protein [Homoserinibacter sp. GY 40078]|uniref:type IV pilus modification PilV family protein n=1 Tax=Homoserinibacter sp. GY 40078 TaxID=2603275 RepID=UPI00164EE064|nr:carboxypeptidase-like regulatory domain-containing protein [Homoserinibacter sp. GY 40078]